MLNAPFRDGFPMTEVLLTGAAGFLGQHVARELLAAGARVRALSRREETDRVLAALGAAPVRGDVNDPESLRRAMAGVSCVFHTAADTNTWRPNNDAQTRTNVGGAQNLVAAAREAGVSGFVHTSSVSAYSHLVHGMLREDVPQRYGESYLMGGEQATFLDLITRVGVMLGKKTPRRATPAFALRAYAQVLYGVSLLTRRMPEITPEGAVFTCKELWVDSSKAIAELGYRQTPLDSLLADTIAWMREQKMIG